MTAPLASPAVALRNSRRLQIGSALLAGVALFAMLDGGWRLAVAAIVAAIFLNIAAIEGLRVVVATLPERRR